MIDPADIPRSRRMCSVKPYRRTETPAWIDLVCDGNEGPVPRLGATHRIDPLELRSYPDASGLEQLFAERIGLDSDRCAVFAGGDELLDRACRAFLDPGDTAVHTKPGFSMIDHYLRLAGARIVSPTWESGPYPIEEVLTAVREHSPGIAFLVSPNNPTGRTVPFEVVELLADSVPVLILDHAYVEFASEDLTRRALGLGNTVVLRTLSKAYGLAGLRLGFALGDPSILGILRAAGGPYSVASPSIALGLRVLSEGAPWLLPFVEAVREERDYLRQLLDRAGFLAPPSEANFVYAQGPRADWLVEGLAAQGISIRRLDGPEGEPALRISCAGPGSRDRLHTAITTSLFPKRLLFDPSVGLPEALEQCSIPIEPVEDPAAASRPGDWVLQTDRIDQATEDRIARASALPIVVNSRSVPDTARRSVVLDDPSDLLEVLP